MNLDDMPRQWITSASGRKRHFVEVGIPQEQMRYAQRRVTLCGRLLDVATAHYGATRAEACEACAKGLVK